MATSRTAQGLALIEKNVRTAKSLQIAQLSAQNEWINGRQVELDSHSCINFGSCSYLGLELDPRLKMAVKDGVSRFGTQFSSSRAYLSIGLYEALEERLEDMFGLPAIVSASTTLGHLSNLPVLVEDQDAVILDHQVHASVSMAANLLRARGIHLEMIRHNNMNMLESRIQKLQQKYRRIWYLADGIYSMYGDFAPIERLRILLKRYESLHLYIDDAHGTSWTGPFGAGYVLSQLAWHPRMFVTGSLNKSFAAAGGVLLFPDQKSKEKVRNCGGTMIFSGPIQPPMLAAGIASADIHLSSEISVLQNRLLKKIRFFNQLALELDLSLTCTEESPIRFIKIGQTDAAYDMTKKLKESGFYVNVAAYPSVPQNHAGLRMTIHNHLTEVDIRNLLEQIAFHQKGLQPTPLHTEKRVKVRRKIAAA